MAGKNNIYVGLKPAANSIIQKLREYVVMRIIGSDEVSHIVITQSEAPLDVIIKIANMQGQLQRGMAGLDKYSPKREAYQILLTEIDEFLRVYQDTYLNLHGK